MATMPARPWSFPSRDDLRHVSRWVWLLAALAVAFVLVSVLRASSVTIETLLFSVLAAAPFAASAALMVAAPRQRLAALSALGFAFPLIVRLVQLAFETDIHDLLRMPLPDYQLLAERVQAIVGVFRGLDWMFGLIAVLCLAFYVGSVRSQRGWWIVGIGLALAGVHAVISIASQLPFWSMFADTPDLQFEPLREIALTLLGALGLVAWAYLAAASLDRRLLLIALAGAVQLAQSAFGVASAAAYSLLPQGAPPEITQAADPISAVVWVFYFVSEVLFWSLLVLGILRELPRGRVRPEEATLAQSEAASGGR